MRRRASGIQSRVDLTRGTGALATPIQAPPGRGGLGPALSLGYDTGNGFSPLGLGWDLAQPRVARRTDTGAPSYVNAEDVFLLDGDELLDIGAGVYRPRVERSFRRIERIGSYFEVRNPDGIRSIYGETASDQLHDPADASRILAWMLSRREDANGNVIRYQYRRDTRVVTLAPGLSFPAAQLYLDRIEYNPHGSAWLHWIELALRLRGSRMVRRARTRS